MFVSKRILEWNFANVLIYIVAGRPLERKNEEIFDAENNSFRANKRLLAFVKT